MEIDFANYLNMAVDAVVTYAPRLIGGIAVLVIGFWVSKKLSRIASLSLEKSSLSPEITSFLISMFDLAIKLSVILFAAGMVGFDTSAIVGVLAAAGFAIGLALQGGLGNFASGIIILVFKPYKVGDWIDIDGKFGKVEEIQIFNTLLGTPGQKTLIIPNGQITENVVTNFSKKGSIRLELTVNMPYEQSFPEVEKIIHEVMAANPLILKEPEPMVGLEAYDTHFLVVGVKPFVNPDDFWEVTYQLHRDIKKAFSVNGIKMAYSEGVELGTIGE
ncbi:mechanosensitive ion channel family protein [Jiulongibacter sp. NS-SX5]|uniref:mechanosensitive ion channel family protein n=1 Tax=Jiulongibacter sp. NS-SX5 TaxID=3463854 RepID=UPI004059647D